jgi:hypothetical protein
MADATGEAKEPPLFPFTEAGVGDAISAAMAMRTVKSTIVPFEGLG